MKQSHDNPNIFIFTDYKEFDKFEQWCYDNYKYLKRIGRYEAITKNHPFKESFNSYHELKDLVENYHVIKFFDNKDAMFFKLINE